MEYSHEEIASHNTEADCWVVIGNHGAKKVYDITAFLEDHPGGPEVLLDLAGQDVQDEFEDVGHTKAAREMLQELCIGSLKEDSELQTRHELRKQERISLLKHPSVARFNRRQKPRFPLPLLAMGSAIAVAAVAYLMGYY